MELVLQIANGCLACIAPYPELQLYVQDPLAETKTYQPDNNFRVDYGFWNGEKLIAIDIDGAEPAGYAKDIRRDRLLRRAGVDVIHILNLELTKHKGFAACVLTDRGKHRASTLGHCEGCRKQRL